MVVRSWNITLEGPMAGNTENIIGSCSFGNQAAEQAKQRLANEAEAKAAEEQAAAEEAAAAKQAKADAAAQFQKQLKASAEVLACVPAPTEILILQAADQSYVRSTVKAFPQKRAAVWSGSPGTIAGECEAQCRTGAASLPHEAGCQSRRRTR